MKKKFLLSLTGIVFLLGLYSSSSATIDDPTILDEMEEALNTIGLAKSRK